MRANVFRFAPAISEMPVVRLLPVEGILPALVGSPFCYTTESETCRDVVRLALNGLPVA